MVNNQNPPPNVQSTSQSRLARRHEGDEADAAGEQRAELQE